MRERKLLILDRDGVLNNKPPNDDYVNSKSELISNVPFLEYLSALPSSIVLACATNQQGVGKGLVSRDNLEEIHQEINSILGSKSQKNITFFVCSHLAQEMCECRKPKPGLLHQAMTYFNCGSDETIFVGDQKSDLEAAIKANIQFILYETLEKTIEELSNALRESP